MSKDRSPETFLNYLLSCVVNDIRSTCWFLVSMFCNRYIKTISCTICLLIGVLICMYLMSHQQLRMAPQLKVSSDRLEKTEIKPTTPNSQGEWLIHYTTGAPNTYSPAEFVRILGGPGT